MTVVFVKILRNAELSAIVHGMIPVAWAVSSLPVWILSIHQPPGLRRWLLLPFNIIGPFICVLQAGRLMTGLDWLWAFTSIVYILHATSGLYLDRWTLPPPEPGSRYPSMDSIRTAAKSWNNPRRLLIRPPKHQYLITQRQRLMFALRTIVVILLHWATYIAIELGTLVTLRPTPRDFRSPCYFHFVFDRAALLRAVYCLQWAWLTYIILTVAHAVCAILFVSLLQVDAPDEWPSLWGNPLKVHSIRSFWGIFWQQIGSPSQLSYGRHFSRHVFRLESPSSAEKTFLAFMVFVTSGAIHTITNWASRESTPVDDVHGDMIFLLMNFGAGLVELIVKRVVLPRWVSNQGSMKWESGLGGRKLAILLRVLGLFWTFLFFYVIVPPWQYPYIEADLRRRFMPFNMDIQIPARPSSIS